MEIEELIRSDLWKAIQAHYERYDYTEAVRDAIFFICEIVREKSGLVDKDGSKLIDEALLGKTPALLINKNETTTEKNIQQGVGFALKGIMQAIRDPISHEKTILSENDAQAIILYSNYLLSRVDQSRSFSKIGDIRELLYDEDFTNSEEYAKCLIKEVPIKKRYDLLLALFNDRSNLPTNTLGFFICELLNSISRASFDDFICVVSNSLIRCKDDSALRMYFNYFMMSTYEKIDTLAKLRIEDLVERSLRNGAINKSSNTWESNSEGSLATWVSRKIKKFNSYEKLMSILFGKISRLSSEADYVFKYFSQDLIRDDKGFRPSEIKVIKELLLQGNFDMYTTLVSHSSSSEDDVITKLFSNELAKCKELIDEFDIPF